MDRYNVRMLKSAHDHRFVKESFGEASLRKVKAFYRNFPIWQILALSPQAVSTSSAMNWKSPTGRGSINPVFPEAGLSTQR